MQIACMASWHCGVMVKLLGLVACLVNLKVCGSYPLLVSLTWMCFITTCGGMVFCNTFYYQDMAPIYPPNAQNSECQLSTFWCFPPNAQNSCREPCSTWNFCLPSSFFLENMVSDCWVYWGFLHPRCCEKLNLFSAELHGRWWCRSGCWKLGW